MNNTSATLPPGRKDKHLNETVLPTFLRPTILITDASNALSREANRKSRDSEFLDAIVGTLRADGNVLVPVETAGRVLELLLYLEQVGGGGGWRGVGGGGSMGLGMWMFRG